MLGPVGARLVSAPGRDAEEILRVAGDADVIMCGSGPRFDAATLSRLRCVGIVRYGVGTETIDLDAASRLGKWVANVPDYGTEAVALHALTLALAGVRRLLEADRSVRAGGWGFAHLRPLHLPRACTAGVVGFGRIGRRTAELLAAVGFHVLAHDPIVRVAPPTVELVGLPELLERSDVVSLHAPGDPGGAPLLGERELARMREGSVLVNTARGSVVDLEALVRGLRRGRPGSAALDVFPTEPPAPRILEPVADRLILTPHMAWYTEETETDLRRRAAEEARRLLAGERPRHAVAGPTSERGRP